MSKVSILCATYSENNQKFLDIAVKSILAQTHEDWELIIVSSGEYKAKASDVAEHDRVKLIHSDTRLHFPPAIHLASQNMANDSDYLFIINDDIILQENSLFRMLLILKDAPFTLNPISNCCNGKDYSTVIGFVDDDKEVTHLVSPKYFYEDLAPVVDKIIHRGLYYEPNTAFRSFNPFFATLMSRNTWDTVGGIDPNFKTGKDDLDFAMRARDKGILSAVTFGAMAVHFSGTTADKHMTSKDREECADYFNKKWDGRYRVNV